MPPTNSFLPSPSQLSSINRTNYLLGQIPQFTMVQINDPRKMSATTGKPINPNRDLISGQYSKRAIRDVITSAKKYGVDPNTALAIAMQETQLGKTDDNLGHTLHGKRGLSTTDNLALALKNSLGKADRLGYTDPNLRLQVYNGLGKIFPSTEQDYHGFKMKQIYGVPVPQGGIDMRQNPLYGKRVNSIKDSVIKLNPEIQSMIQQYATGGKNHGGLDRWFAEKWVDIKTGKECGRQEGEKRRSYPACRPSKRINKGTPKTAGELSQSEKERFKRMKTSSARIPYQHKKAYGGFSDLVQMAAGGNAPTNPELWARAKAKAREKYDVYPSAYANGFAAKWYKQQGGGWKKAAYGLDGEDEKNYDTYNGEKIPKYSRNDLEWTYRRAAADAKDNNKPFLLPDGQTKTWDQMDFREKAYLSGLAVDTRFRLQEENTRSGNAWVEELTNPAAFIGNMVGELYKAPYKARVEDSYWPYAEAVFWPLVTKFTGTRPSVAGGALNKKWWTTGNTLSQRASNLFTPFPWSLANAVSNQALNKTAKKVISSATTAAKPYAKEAIKTVYKPLIPIENKIIQKTSPFLPKFAEGGDNQNQNYMTRKERRLARQIERTANLDARTRAYWGEDYPMDEDYVSGFLGQVIPEEMDALPAVNYPMSSLDNEVAAQEELISAEYINAAIQELMARNKKQPKKLKRKIYTPDRSVPDAEIGPAVPYIYDPRVQGYPKTPQPITTYTPTPTDPGGVPVKVDGRNIDDGIWPGWWGLGAALLGALTFGKTGALRPELINAVEGRLKTFMPGAHSGVIKRFAPDAKNLSNKVVKAGNYAGRRGLHEMEAAAAQMIRQQAAPAAAQRMLPAAKPQLFLPSPSGIMDPRVPKLRVGPGFVGMGYATGGYADMPMANYGYAMDPDAYTMDFPYDMDYDEMVQYMVGGKVKPKTKLKPKTNAKKTKFNPFMFSKL